MLAAYQGGAYFDRDYSLTAGGPIGYGYPVSTTAANRTIQESTLSVVRALWKRADLGALQIIGHTCGGTLGPSRRVRWPTLTRK
jgi:hypothetical protein